MAIRNVSNVRVHAASRIAINQARVQATESWTSSSQGTGLKRLCHQISNLLKANRKERCQSEKGVRKSCHHSCPPLDAICTKDSSGREVAHHLNSLFPYSRGFSASSMRNPLPSPLPLLTHDVGIVDWQLSYIVSSGGHGY
ncbi:unnamed protein product [Pleuronectes platessa]|uniref:Uncharacterized protein n=1 Tax=Pleuronectes platessa TaxID=8262 RepID=A0A9N7Z7R1_PLEPL|nr:unnamed protein product [Pleuronectes platessa]